MNITKRNLLRVTALAAPALALSACSLVSSNTVNGVTTITLNVAKLAQYAQAAQNFGSGIVGFSFVSAALGAPGLAVIDGALTGIAAAVTAISKQANGAVSISYTTTSIPAAVVQFEADLQTILTAAKTAIASLKPSQLTATISNMLAAFESIASLAEAFVGAVGAAPQMPEAQALAVLGVKG